MKKLQVLRIAVLVLAALLVLVRLFFLGYDWGRSAAAQTQVPQAQVTRLAPAQLKLRILAIEWSKCQAAGAGDPTATPPAAPWDCNGIELYRFRMSDGTIRGPFLAVAAPADFVKDAKWVDQSLDVP